MRDFVKKLATVESIFDLQEEFKKEHANWFTNSIGCDAFLNMCGSFEKLGNSPLTAYLKGLDVVLGKEEA